MFGHEPAVVTSVDVTTTSGSHVSVAVAAGKTATPGHSTGETTAGQVMIGAVVSTTVMVWATCELLPQMSVAVHVRVCATGHVPLVVSAKVIVGFGSQTSVATAVAKSGAPGHSTVFGPPPDSAIRGGTLSISFTI